MKLADLANKFERKDLSWRVMRSGLKNDKPWAVVVPYVDSRAIMDRLDEVCGPGNWCDDYQQWNGGVICKLSILVGDTWVFKTDGSEATQIEGFKGAISKALVRAAVKWGIGRYLYDAPTVFAKFHDKGKHTHKDKETGKYFRWDPDLPEKK